MSEIEPAEDNLLDRHEPSWVAQGYRVVRHPSRTSLPPFFDKYQPDAILLDRTPQVVVEIVRKGQPNVEQRIRDLKALLDGHEDWRLEVVYTGEEQGQLPGVPTDRLREGLESARRLALVDVRGALLLLWATLEAITRRLEPDRTKRPQSPGRVVELLAGAGYIAPSEAEELRKSVQWRNRLVHGDLGASPSAVEFPSLASIVEDLIGVIERQCAN